MDAVIANIVNVQKELKYCIENLETGKTISALDNISLLCKNVNIFAEYKEISPIYKAATITANWLIFHISTSTNILCNTTKKTLSRAMAIVNLRRCQLLLDKLLVTIHKTTSR